MIQAIDNKQWTEDKEYRFETLKTLYLEFTGLDYSEKINRLKGLDLHPGESYKATNWETGETVDLPVAPTTNEELSVYNRWYLDFWRNTLFERTEYVNGLSSDLINGVDYGAERYLHNGIKVIPFETRKADLLARLDKSDEPDELIKGERTEIRDIVDKLPNGLKIKVEVALDLLCGRKEWWQINDSHYLTMIGKRLQFGPNYLLSDSPTHLYMLAEVWDLIKYQRFIEKSLEEILQGSATDKPSIGSLLPQMNDKQIKALFKGLIENGVLDFDVLYTDFEEVIKGASVLNKPLCCQSNRNIAYLFNTMFAEKLINNNEWKSVIENRRLFQKMSGEPLRARDISVAIDAYGNAKTPPKKAPFINKIIDEVKALKT